MYLYSFVMQRRSAFALLPEITHLCPPSADTQEPLKAPPDCAFQIIRIFRLHVQFIPGNVICPDTEVVNLGTIWLIYLPKRKSKNLVQIYMSNKALR